MITVITGPMVSGKTTRLQKVVQNATTGTVVDIVIPRTDTRSKGILKARGALCGYPARVVDRAVDIVLGLPPSATKLIIDEAQFFDSGIVQVLLSTQESGLDVVVAGLNLTAEGMPFGEMANILAIADYVYMLKGRCQCGLPATRTTCINKKTAEVLIGDSDIYKATCYKCWSNHNNR